MVSLAVRRPSLCYSQLYEYVPTANTGAVLYKVACSLCAALADPQRQKACHSVGNLPALLHQFASQAATLVEPGEEEI